MWDTVELQRAVAEWAERTFGHPPLEVILAKADDEFRELQAAATPEERAEEAADVVLLLMHLAHRDGFNLMNAVGRKFQIVQERVWAAPDERGVFRHLKPGDRHLKPEKES